MRYLPLKNKNAIYYAIIIVPIVLSFQFSLMVIFNLFGTQAGTYLQFSSKVVSGVFIINALYKVSKKSVLIVLIPYMITLIIYCINFIFVKETYSLLINNAVEIFLLCLPLFIVSSQVESHEKLIYILTKAAKFIFIFILIAIIFVLIGYSNISDYSMPLSYYILVPIVISLYKILYEKDGFYWLVLVISLFIMIAYGSRGAIVSIFSFILIYIMGIIIQRNSLKDKAKISILLLLLLTVSLNFKTILIQIQGIMINLNINSRTVNLLLLDDIHLSGRDNIYSIITNSIYDNPLRIHGLFYDRVLLNGLYAHNLFLELFINFGVFIGGTVLIMVLLRYFRIMMSNKQNALLNIYFSIAFIPLLYSGSYLTDYNFWVFLGLLFSSSLCVRSKKNEEKIDKRPGF